MSGGFGRTVRIWIRIGNASDLITVILGTHSLWYIMSESKMRNVTWTTIHIKSLLTVLFLFYSFIGYKNIIFNYKYCMTNFLQWFKLTLPRKLCIYFIIWIHTQPSKHGEHSDWAPKECSDMLLLQNCVSLSHRAHLWDSPSPKQ